MEKTILRFFEKHRPKFYPLGDEWWYVERKKSAIASFVFSFKRYMDPSTLPNITGFSVVIDAGSARKDRFASVDYEYTNEDGETIQVELFSGNLHK
ncbi:hypothetical protein [Bacillus sp. FJAT-44742]|uniref:hypothetical protein n=1 Tax=Bacillus sp. FJAT-44742 TaxID=2014005 RepID=UPI000C24C9B3|nr:hypothetical protein [Bacillus sp. FJAT-44742]